MTYFCKFTDKREINILEQYSSGLRGPSAKGLVRRNVKREFESHLFRKQLLTKLLTIVIQYYILYVH